MSPFALFFFSRVIEIFGLNGQYNGDSAFYYIYIYKVMEDHPEKLLEFIQRLVVLRIQ